jgi:hypothetical protein
MTKSLTHFGSILLMVIGIAMLPHIAAAAVAFHAAGEAGEISNLTSTSWNHTVSGTNRYLVVGISGWDNSSSLSGITVTYNGDTMTRLGGLDTGGNNVAVLFGLVNPDTGTNQVSITGIPAGFSELAAGSVSFTGVDQSTPTGTLVTEADGSVNITQAAGDLGIDILYEGDDIPSPAADGVERVSVAAAAFELRMQTRGGTGSVTMAWTPVSDATLTAVPIKAAADAPAGGSSTLVKPPNNLGLVGYWSFNEGTSTRATDFSGNGNHGTFSNIANPPTVTSGWTNGKRSKALALDDSNDLVTVQNSPSLENTTSTFTATFWFKSNGFADFQDIVSKSDGSNCQWCISANASNDLDFFFSDASTLVHNMCTGCNLSANQWHHIGITYDAAANAIVWYVNGSVVADNNANETTNMTSKTYDVIFGEAVSGEECNCVLDELRIYNRVLTGNELASLSRTGAVRFTSNSKTLTQGSSLENSLVGLWTFDGQDATDRIYDRSGNNNHGYVFNGATSSMKTIGKLGQALDFDGANDYIETNSITFGSAFSFSFWFKDDGTANGDDLVSWSAFRFCNRTVSGGDFELQCSPNSSPGAVTSTTVVFGDGEWHHAVFTATAGSQSLYIDGVLEDTGSAAMDTDNATVRLAGKDFDGETFNGKLDDVRVYNRVLTASEAKQLYNLGKAKITQ